ncbi:MAG: penicillin-insensitive murein endopeptidase [Deltaproteobacteria bacterium]|nr:penicillin-insensitive murein endopeptidase [Deltaproteobacteria bacterium]
MARPALLVLPLACLFAQANPAFAECHQDTGARAGSGCSDQFLEDGVQLPENPHLYHRMNPSTAWGIPDLVDLLIEAGVRMREHLPYGSPFVVGDLSTERGGELEPHKTHRGGVDADIGLYRGGAWQPLGILPFPAADLDVAANFLLLSTLLQSGRVDLILLDRAHISTLRTWAVSHGVLDPTEAKLWFPPAGSRMERVGVGVVRHAPGHDGHIHLRVLCPDGSRAR